MTRDDALLKVLAIEPARRDDLVQVTGWPPVETLEVLARLLDQGRITYWNGHGSQWYRLSEQRRAIAPQSRTSPHERSST